MNTLVRRLAWAISFLYGFGFTLVMLDAGAWMLIPKVFDEKVYQFSFVWISALLFGILVTAIIRWSIFTDGCDECMESVSHKTKPQKIEKEPVAFVPEKIVSKKATPIASAKTPKSKKAISYEFSEETIAQVKNMSVANVSEIIFAINGASEVTMKRAALNRLMLFVVDTYKKTSFSAGELTEFYDFVMKYYRTSLSSDQRKQIMDILEQLTKKGGKVTIVKE
jgi:uncharacterized protein YggL (DUF469 family)